MTDKTYTRRTINRLRTAQDEIHALAAHARHQASKWLKDDVDKLHVPVPLQYTDQDGDTTLLVKQSLGGDQHGEDWAEHHMPVKYLYATDEEIEADYRKFQELLARFNPTATA